MNANGNLGHEFWRARAEEVDTAALMPHREFEHGPGYTFGVGRHQKYAPKHTPEAWAANVESVRQEGIREPIHLAYDPSSRRGFISEGNSRLAWASEAGLAHVPVVGHKVPYVPEHDRERFSVANYDVPGEPKLRKGEGHFPADFRVSGVLPDEYFYHSPREAE